MGKPSITIISLNYAPEDTAIGLYSSQMAEYLFQNGWDVQVIAGFPYYPKWEISKEYKSKRPFYNEEINGVNVFRYKQFVPKNPSFLKRSFQIIDFTIGTFFNLNKVKKTDIVLSVIPYTSSSWLGNILAKRMKAKHWIHIQDFEFAAAFESGLSSKKGVMKLIISSLFKLEKSILDKSTLVSTISQGMLRQLKSKTNQPNYFFPNWVDETFINPETYSHHSFFEKNKFNVLYSGNIGGKQDWDLFIDVVFMLKENSNIQFIIVGDGATKRELEDKLINQPNVKFYNPVAYEDLNNLLCSASLHLLFQKNEVVDTVMPSKILGMMASRKPSIVTGNSMSEVCYAFEESKGGVFIENNNVTDICNTISKFESNVELCTNSGANARTYVLSNFTKNVILSKFKDKLNSL